VGLIDRRDRHDQRVVDFQNAAGQGRYPPPEPSRAVVLTCGAVGVVAVIAVRLLRMDVITGTSGDVVLLLVSVGAALIFGLLLRWWAKARRAGDEDRPDEDRTAP